ncbi:outer membrane beta-barrel protein [Pseudodesulfovibrio sp. JC047]|uniref:outer membrane protein n=1 Tax=Pseudodesulfovibrio sp. JC047 TaxID=2683199 RepID=UPI0013D4BE7D|nr:outer membrane beta-barrel protein [Pseudodesulfovibrio sp. JC047]NDV19126.1 outer membrane beta-barrel protein [Pseudodesulfovibrio sp. JC047]
MRFRAVSTILFLVIFNAGFAAAQSNDIASWDGQYVGFGIGGAWGKADPEVQTQKGTYFITTDPDQLDPEGSRNMYGSDLSGNVFFGFNGQKDRFVYGVEGNLSLSKYDETHHSGNVTYLTLPTDSFSITTKVKSDWAVSIRPRVGYALEKSLIYITAGPILRRFEYDFTFTDTEGGGKSLHFNKEAWKLGLIGGLGYEHKLLNDWSVRTEYLFSTYTNIIDGDSRLASYPEDGFKHDLDFTEHSLCIGISKRF